MALAQSSSWEDAKNTLIQMHYKPNANGEKVPLFTKRWHYTSDRLLNHTITPHVSNEFVDASKLKNVSLTLNQKQDGSEFLELNWTKSINLSYIPNDMITNELLATLPSMIGVAFVKESYFKMGVVMAHEGMIMDGKFLLHAGQVAEKTVSESFMNYYFTEKGPRFDGIMLYRLKPYKK